MKKTCSQALVKAFGTLFIHMCSFSSVVLLNNET